MDLDSGTLRLDPGTTKNREGRVTYLAYFAIGTRGPRLLSARRESSCGMSSTAKGKQSAITMPRGAPRASVPVYLDGPCTTFAVQPPGTTCALVYPSALRWIFSVIRHGRSSTGTTSRASKIFARLLSGLLPAPLGRGWAKAG